MHDAVQLILREVLREGVASPFADLVLRLRDRGVAVTEGVLERRLRAEGSGFRLLDPWRGPQGVLRTLLPPGADGPSTLWVVPDGPTEEEPGAPGGDSGVERALRCLGRAVDERSPRDVARWMALVEEARRLRGRAA